MNAPARVVDLDADQQDIQVSVDQLGVSAAEVNQQIATAKRYPRSVAKFRTGLLSNVTLTEEIAASCYYCVPRDGKDIEGPSTRLAEMALSEWGNCRATARIVQETDNFIVAQGIFIDLERNVAVGVEVNRRIVDKKGRRFSLDMIGVTAAAAMSIALRNAIFRGIPRVFIDEAYEAAKATVAGKLATLSDKRNRMLDAFKAYGITEAQILRKMEKEGMAEIGERELVTLRGYLTAIKQEEKDPSEIFVATPVSDETAQRRAAPPPATKPNPPAAGASAGADAPEADGGAGGEGQAPPADTDQDDVPVHEPARATADTSQLEASISAALAKCKTGADIQGVASLFGGEIADVDADAQERIEKLFDDARADLFPADR